MTRFARAKGSKASNERVPEEPTSWNEMKNQLLEKNQQSQQIEKQREAEKQRAKNYQTFLKEMEEEKSKNLKWAEFTDKKSNDKIETTNNGTHVDIKGKKSKGKLQIYTKAKRDENDKKMKPGGKSNQTDKIKKEPKLKINGDGEGEQPQRNKIIKVKAGKKNNETSMEGEQPTKKGIKRKLNEPETITKKRMIESENAPISNYTKFQKKEQKFGSKNRKLIQNRNKKKVEKPEKGVPLTEEELEKIEKKKQKKIRQVEKRKLHKPQKGAEQKPERRKKPQERMIINGKEVEIAYVDGFPIKKEDAQRIHQLRKQMISKGLPRSEIKIALKLERRKAEKAFAREKKKVCFNCRKSGHNLSECPELGNESVSTATGICFKCGSTEHTHFDCKVVKEQKFQFAQCFICHEQGHIARQCPDNARGLYPKGGACKVCGDVTHLKKDCPKFQAQQQQLEENLKLDTINSDDNPDVLDRDVVKVKNITRPNKIIKF